MSGGNGPPGQLVEDAAELEALVRAGGFWRLAPSWLPRAGYTATTPAVLRDVETGLIRRLSDG